MSGLAQTGVAVGLDKDLTQSHVNETYKRKFCFRNLIGPRTFTQAPDIKSALGKVNSGIKVRFRLHVGRLGSGSEPKVELSPELVPM